MGKTDEEDYRDAIRCYCEYLNNQIEQNCVEIKYCEKLSEVNTEFNRITEREKNKTEIDRLKVMTQALEIARDNLIDILGDYDISLSEIMGD